MKNIWTQHLKKPGNYGCNKNRSFTKMLHSFVKEENKADSSFDDILLQANTGSFKRDEAAAFHADPVDENSEPVFSHNSTEPPSVVELIRWTAKSQKGHEMESEEYEDDYVRLLRMPDGELLLKYTVTGEESFEMKVESEEEAECLIEEDNATTSQLYPENPELQWTKNKMFLI